MNIDALLLGLGYRMIVRAPEDGTGGGEGQSTNTSSSDQDGDDTSASDTALGDDTGAKPEDGDGKEKTALDDADTDKDGTSEEGDDESDADDTVPEDGVYEFELPEGVELSDEDKTAWSTLFKDTGLTQKQANALVAAQAERVAAEQAAYATFLETQQKEHLDAAKADKEIGGDKWDESVKLAKRGFEMLGGSAIKNLILTSGNGNNPEMIRELRRIGAMSADDTFQSGTPNDATVPTEKSWYGDTTPETKKG